MNAFRGGTSLLYDYYGFPEEAYGPNLICPAPSDQGLQERTLDLLQVLLTTLEKLVGSNVGSTFR